MPVILTDEEAQAVGFMCACYLDDTKKAIRKQARSGGDLSYAKQRWVENLKLVYSKLIPGSWCGSQEALARVTFDSKET